VYVRAFVRPNKRAEKDWLQLVANRDQKHILPVIESRFGKDLNLFHRKAQQR
jgi:hypothetical protein